MKNYSKRMEHKLLGFWFFGVFLFMKITKCLLRDASYNNFLIFSSKTFIFSPRFFLKILETKKTFENSSINLTLVFVFNLNIYSQFFPSLILLIPTWSFIFWKFHSHFRKSSFYEKCYCLQFEAWQNMWMWVLTQITHALSATK